jgi:hypothetical protein
MKRHHILGLAFLAVFAFSAVLAASASAEVTLLAEWLIKGAAVLTLTSVQSKLVTGTEMLFEDMKEGVDIDCAVVNSEGSVGPNGEDEITAVTIGTCTTLAGTCGSPEIKAENLPWNTLLILDQGTGAFLDLLSEKGAGFPAYVTDCLVLGFLVEDLCSSNTGSATIDNTAESDVVALFNEDDETGICSLSNGIPLLLGEQLITTLTGEALAASSEA